MTVKVESARFRTLLLETIILPAFMIAVAAALLIWLTTYLFDAIYWTQHSSKVIAKLSECRELTLDFETSKRGYLFYADPVFLNTHTLAVTGLVPALNELRMRVCDNPTQVARAVELKRSALDLLQSGEQQMEARARGVPVNPSRVLSDKAAMDNLRLQFDTMQQTEEQISTKRFERLHRARLIFLWVGSGLVLVLAVLVSLTVRRQFTRLADHYRMALINLENRSTELHEQKEWFRVTLISIGEAVIVTDVGGRIVFMNSEAERMTEWSSVDAIRRPLADVFQIVNDETGLHLDSPVEKVLREGRSSGSGPHTTLISRDHREWPINESAAPVVDSFGKLRGVVLVFHDASGPRQEQKILRDQAALLEETVQERTEKLVESVREMEGFCYAVSHDLRSPLRAMQGYAEIILEEHGASLTPEVRDYSQKIKRAAERLNGLVTDLLAHSRAAGTQSLLQTKILNLKADGVESTGLNQPDGTPPPV